MRFRKLRIAWSLGCAIACMLLIALWVRSYWWVTNIQVPNILGHDNQMVLSQGTIHISSCFNYEPESMSALIHNYHRSTIDYNDFSGAPEYRQFLFRVQELGRYDLRLIFPYWSAAIVSAAIAALPWLSCIRRFSLRTLLIATTLLAVLLGLIVAVTRK
jgi:hypothetical protein